MNKRTADQSRVCHPGVSSFIDFERDTSFEGYKARTMLFLRQWAFAERMTVFLVHHFVADIEQSCNS
jgi:hypothetical protein